MGNRPMNGPGIRLFGKSGLISKSVSSMAWYQAYLPDIWDRISCQIFGLTSGIRLISNSVSGLWRIHIIQTVWYVVHLYITSMYWICFCLAVKCADFACSFPLWNSWAWSVLALRQICHNYHRNRSRKTLKY